MVILAVIVVACTIYANLSFLVTNRTNYRYFPPFMPYVNANGNWGLGGEYFHIAQALASGEGFAHPFNGQTGPTAWQPPVLPSILAGLLWLSNGNRSFVVTVVVCLNVMVLIWTGLVVVTLARQTKTRLGVGPIMAIFIFVMLSQFNQCFQRAHDGWLVLLSLNVLLTALCWRTTPQSSRSAGRSVLPWIGWGLFGGLGAQVSPVIGSSWGILSVALAIQRRAWTRLAIALSVATLTVVPWTVRNYLVFGRLIPLKSNLAFEAYQSQCLQSDGLLLNLQGHPGAEHRPEGKEYRMLGERAFLERKRQQFWEAVGVNPLNYVDKVANRLLAATVWYMQFNRENEAQPSWVLWVSRLTHPLPFLAWVALLLTAVNKPLHRTQWILIGLYIVHLLPYILVSYYERYAAPLLTVKAFLVVGAIDRLLGLWSKDTRKTGKLPKSFGRS